jgi:hypothetical protein
LRPPNNTPRLDDPAVRYQLEISSDDVAGKKREGATDVAIDLGLPTARKRTRSTR